LAVVAFVGTSVTLFGAAPAVAGRASTASARPDPVLLVHGFRGSSSGWHALETSLRAQGYRAAEIDAIDYDSDASNVDIARDIAREADALRARTGAARIDVVTHSMGAISSRYWMDHLGGAAKVDAWVSLAGVNEGTVWAYGCYVLTPCREMVPTSSVLDGLSQHVRVGVRATGTTRYAAWWSPCDEAIVPRTNAELPGARNVETACLDHTEMRTDPHVLEQVVRFLRPDSLRQPASGV
jgi:triacylglycerol esterase/lipase EstA (alpha/beta hydrolase family)